MSEINLKDIETGAEPSTVILGADPFDNAERSIYFVGALNGDGMEEILIGAPYAEQAGSEQDAGAAHLMFGAANPLTQDLSTIEGGADGGFAIEAASPSDQVGASVAGVGDNDGDGFDDFGVGAPFSDISGPGRLGAIALIQGGAGTVPILILSGGQSFSALTVAYAPEGESQREQQLLALPAGPYGADQSNVLNPGIAPSDFPLAENAFAVSTAYPPTLPAASPGAGKVNVIGGDGFRNGRTFGDAVIDVGLDATLGAGLTTTGILGADLGDEAGKSLAAGERTFAASRRARRLTRRTRARCT